MKLLVDTNVLARWVNRLDPSHMLAVNALARLGGDGHTPTLVPQCIYEFWSVATRPKEATNGLGMDLEAASAIADRLAPPLFLLLQDERAIFPIWRDLVTRYSVRGKPSHDARLVAAMLRHKLTHILTFNTADFARYTEIEAIHPTQIFDGSVVLPVD